MWSILGELSEIKLYADANFPVTEKGEDNSLTRISPYLTLHTHTCRQTHRQADTRTHTHARERTHTQAGRYTGTHARARTHTNRQAGRQTDTYTDTQKYTHQHSPITTMSPLVRRRIDKGIPIKTNNKIILLHWHCYPYTVFTSITLTLDARLISLQAGLDAKVFFHWPCRASGSKMYWPEIRIYLPEYNVFP